MEIKRNQVDELNIELTMTINAEDYSAKEKKKLNEIRKTAEFKGFRKGMVPLSLIQKVYGGQVLADAVNDVIGEELNKYITDEKLHILGEPIGSEKQPELEWESGKDFTFIFDLGLAPTIEFEIAKEDVLNHYNINITEKAKKEMKDNIRKYDESKKEKTDEELEEEVVAYLERTYKQEADYKLTKDIRDYCVQKADLKLPEDFLKRWLIIANKGKVTEEQMEKEFPAFLRDFRWQMVRDYLFGKFEHNISEQDLDEAAKTYISYQFAMYGMPQVTDEILEEYSKQVLQDEKQLQRIIEQIQDQKVYESVKSNLTVKSKKISADKFRELD